MKLKNWGGNTIRVTLREEGEGSNDSNSILTS